LQIPAKSLSTAVCTDLVQNLYGNPHSNSAPSRLSTARVDEIRNQVLHFFHADPKNFDLVFTANATAAIKLVGECFRDYAHETAVPKTMPLLGRAKPKSFWYGYHRDAHTSLIGLRELGDGKHRCFTSQEEVVEWITSNSTTSPNLNQPALFAFPGQSNMTGRRLPLTWPRLLRNSRNNAYTLLDAAALSTCSQLELDRDEPDFTAVSFYKIFGTPDIGALIIRKASAHLLQKRRYFGGGTVGMVISLDATWHAKKTDSIHDQLEEGTLPFHSIIALGHAINVHKKLFTSMSQISSHTSWLGQYAYTSMMATRHGNGAPVFLIYKDKEAIYSDSTTQGATIAFNILRGDGIIVPCSDVEEDADKERIYVRSGGLCNSGGVATYLKLTERDLRAAYARGHRCNKPILQVEGRATGVVRISMGAMSTRQDIDRFVSFVQETYVLNSSKIANISFENEIETVAFSMPVSINQRARHYLGEEKQKVPRKLQDRRNWFQKVVDFCAKADGKTY
jgi:molybdenum cofactor sulfurtransferase